MSGYQRAVLLATIALVAFMLLFPPWYSMGRGPQGLRRIHRGYSYLNDPPPGDSHINYERYLVPIAVVCLLALLGYLELQRPSAGRGPQQDRDT
jgi:hypothetical protein